MNTSTRLPFLLRLALPTALVALRVAAANAQVATSWMPGDGSWSDASKWTAGVPNSANADVYIDNQPGMNSVVTLGMTSVTFGRLRIDAGDRVETSPGIVGIAISSNAFAGAGELLLNGTFAISENLSFDGIKTINGSGKFVLGSAVNRPEITGVTNNNATIEGAANFGRYTNSSYPGTINNTGIVNANRSGAALTFNSAFDSTNSNLIEATNGGLLSLEQGSITNTGTGRIVADGPNSVAHFGGFSVTGGTLEGKNGGVLRAVSGALWKDLIVAGTANLSGGTLLVDGTVSVSGTLTVPNGSNIYKANNPNPVTFAGAGEIVLDGTTDTGPELIDQGNQQWTFQGLTVRGRGNVGYPNSNGSIDSVSVLNRATFQADVDGQMLLIDVASFDNQSSGVLRATGSGNNALGGILRLALNGPLKNTGGTIEALSGGRVEAAFARIEGGLIRALPATAGRTALDGAAAIASGEVRLGGMTLVNPGTGLRLEGDLKLGLPGVNQEAFIIGEIENAGILRIAATSNFARLRIGDSPSRSASLAGGGQVILGDEANGSTESALMEFSTNSQTFTLTNVDNTIRGFGRIGDPNYDRWLIINNKGSIAADVPGKTLQIELHTAGNPGGTFRAANGGQLRLWTRFGFDNVDGTLEALNSSPFNFAGATTITGGTLSNVGAAANATNFDLAGSALINLTLQGPLVIRDSGQTTLVGVIQNEGTIRVRNENSNVRTRLSIGSGATNSVTLNGPGELILGDAALGGDSAYVEAAQGTNNPTLTLNQNLRGFGALGFNQSSDRGMHLVNNAIVNADVNGKQLVVVPHTIVNSPGKELKASNGGTLYLHPVQLTNNAATISAAAASAIAFDTQTTVTGGVVSSAPGGSINVLRDLTANGGVVFTNAGTMNIGSLGGSVINGLANGGSTIVSFGTINKLGGSDYYVNSPLNNTGAIHVQSGILRWMAGGAVAGANLSSADGTNLTFQDEPFTFSGNNTFTGAGNHWFANNTVTLADPAALNVTGNFNFGSYGTSILSGDGTMNVSGRLTIHPATTIFSDTHLITAAGSSTSINKQNTPLQFTGDATWENSGTVTLSGYINKIDGETGTHFTNTESGVLRSDGAQENRLQMPYTNSGTFDIAGSTLFVNNAGTFNKGSAAIAAGRALQLESAALQFVDTNTLTGAGSMENVSSALTFAPGAKLNTAAAFGLHAGSSLSGGEINITRDFGFHNYYSPPMIVSGTQINIADTSTGRFRNYGGIIRFQGNARFANAGNIDIQEAPTLELTTNAVFENNGTLNVYNSPGFGGDDTGRFKTGFNSKTRFYTSPTMSWPFDIAGEIYAENGNTATFDKGGLFNETAKIWPNHPNSNITFTGATPYQSRGRAVEFPGTGYVNFVNTTLEFLPSTLSTTGNGELDETSINAGARVAFHGDNIVKSSQALIDLGRQGTLNTTGFVFQNGSQIVDNAILQTSGTANDSVWNATGQKLTLRNGAKFINGGRFVIQSRVGSGLAGDPGITTDNTTTLFHNTSTGRLVHDTNNTTDFNINFLNEGFLEFRAGTFNFLKSFSGRGGIAVSNGAQVSLSLVGVPLDQQPAQFELLGSGSGMSLQLAVGQTLAGSILSNGGQMVAAGGLNMVAAGGLNMVAAGGGNIVAAGGMNMVAAGGGNITAQGVGSLINANDMIGLDGGTMIGLDGGTLLARVSALVSNGSFASMTNARFEAAQAVQINNAAAIAQAAGEIRGGGGILSQNGGVMVAAGGGNLVAAGGGNMVAAGGGNRPAMFALVQSRVNAVKAAAEVATARAVNAVRGEHDELLMGNDSEVMSGSDSGIISVEAGGTATAQGGGSITADAGGILIGGGTFNGPGEIKSGGALMPGSSVGTLTWNGNITFNAGSVLDLEIGGPSAGTQYDVLNVSGTCAMNGMLSIRFLNGFGGSVQPGHTFDVLTTDGGITAAVAGTRVAVFGATGTFAVQLVNDGKTLRLADYQPGAVTFSNWAASYGLSGANATWTADPNHNGLANLLEYALGIDPTIGGSTGIATGTVEENGQKYLTLSYTKPTGAEAPPDIIYLPERASSLALNDWSSAPADVVPYGITPGPGSLETVTVRSTHPLSTTNRDFLRLNVSLNP